MDLNGRQFFLPHPLSLASMSGCVNQAMIGVVDFFMIKENNDLIICAQHCDPYDMVANCNIMLTNKVKNILLCKWFRLIEQIIFTMVSVLRHTLFNIVAHL